MGGGGVISQACRPGSGTGSAPRPPSMRESSRGSAADAAAAAACQRRFHRSPTADSGRAPGPTSVGSTARGPAAAFAAAAAEGKGGGRATLLPTSAVRMGRGSGGGQGLAAGGVGDIGRAFGGWWWQNGRGLRSDCPSRRVPWGLGSVSPPSLTHFTCLCSQE